MKNVSKSYFESQGVLRILRLPFVRSVIFSLLVLLLLFFDQLNVGLFFLLGALYSLIELFFSKKRFDLKTGINFIDIGWLFIVLITMILVVIKLV